jgi:hypothetical protein
MVNKFAQQIAEDKNANREALVMTRPPDQFKYDGILALRAAARLMAGEPLPSPEQVAETNLEWESEVMKAVQRIKFEEDYSKRPAFLQ